MVVALGAAGVLLQAEDPGAGQALQGSAPPIELAPLDDGGGAVSLAELRGQPVVVNFFASWCVPCRKELPAFADVATRFDGRVAFLGVNHSDSRAGGLAMVDEFDVPYPAGYDPKGDVAIRYGLFAMPSTVFISAEGEMVERHTGEMSRPQLEEALARLFGLS